ncbi:MAG: hypothetical protein JXX14_05570, partial [Deltaproteobacteria bacterium]|nr:hypothetical protein [Deltaproteobacteria bacterium]
CHIIVFTTQDDVFCVQKIDKSWVNSHESRFKTVPPRQTVPPRLGRCQVITVESNPRQEPPDNRPHPPRGQKTDDCNEHPIRQPEIRIMELMKFELGEIFR